MVKDGGDVVLTKGGDVMGKERGDWDGEGG